MISIKSAAEIEIMAEAGRRLAGILKVLKAETRIGVSTRFLDERSLELIKKAGAEPAFLGYRPSGAKRPFPATLCISLNEIVVHGLPSDYVLQEGDLVKLDLGIKYQGFYVDSALTVGTSKLGPLKNELISVAQKALVLAINQVQAGKTLGDIGFAVENFVKSRKFSVVKSLTGHGIGRSLHEEPSVFNFGRPGQGEKLRPGMVLAMEVMIAAGRGEIKQLFNDSFATVDGSPSAHFEHTVAITEGGPRILTRI